MSAPTCRQKTTARRGIIHPLLVMNACKHASMSTLARLHRLDFGVLYLWHICGIRTGPANDRCVRWEPFSCTGVLSQGNSTSWLSSAPHLGHFSRIFRPRTFYHWRGSEGFDAVLGSSKDECAEVQLRRRNHATFDCWPQSDRSP